MRVLRFYILLNLTACTMASEPKLVEVSATVQEPDTKSAFVECMKEKTVAF